MYEQNPKVAPLSEEESRSLWQNLLRTIEKREKQKKRTRFVVAASITILLAVGGGFYYNEQTKPETYFAGNANLNIRLEDGSIVTLLKGAKLTVENNFPAETRDVYLEGDALFTVTKDTQHPFIVHGLNYDTKVLGTVFKVVQSGKTFNVDLYEGKVSVNKATKPAETFVLHPKQTFTNFGITEAAAVMKTPEARLSNNSKPSNKEIPVSITLNECMLKDAVKVIERSYGIKIEYPHELDEEKVSIVTENVSAQNILESLAIRFNLIIRNTNDSIYQLEK